MKIIIVGCGKVGYTLVEQLGSEDHDIVVIDEKPEKVSTITNNLDAMGIVGKGKKTVYYKKINQPTIKIVYKNDYEV